MEKLIVQIIILLFISHKTKGYIEENNGNIYLMLLSVNKSKAIPKRYEELWEIKSQIYFR